MNSKTKCSYEFSFIVTSTEGEECLRRVYEDAHIPTNFPLLIEGEERAEMLACLTMMIEFSFIVTNTEGEECWRASR